MTKKLLALIASTLLPLASTQLLDSLLLPEITALLAAKPTATISTFPEATSALEKSFPNRSESQRDILSSAVSLIESGFFPDDLPSIIHGFLPPENSPNNSNPISPSQAIYPSASPGEDAPYLLPESTLRSAIFIPPTFTYGQKPPVILFPGTAVPGGKTFAYTYGRVLAETTFADPLWLNIPGNSLGDAQTTAEYAAYAINYIADITKQNISIVTFSQGSLNVQWALKYWPSTRRVTSNFIALSPDFRGTVNAEILCPPGLPVPGCTPGVLQQYFDSMFVKTLGGGGGDSAYVPTTNVRSATDQIVEPQVGEFASGVLADSRGVGVTNVLVQEICPLTPAGTLVTHEGMVYNALAYALAVDALMNGGPGQLDRISVKEVCSRFVAEGMSLEDLLAEESTFVVFFVNFLLYQPRTTEEPPIRGYAA